MKLSAVHHVAIVTANFATMKQFYTEVLGLEVVGKFTGRDIIFLKTGPITIELVSRETHVAGTSGGWDHFAFEVDDIDATAAARASMATPTTGRSASTAPRGPASAACATRVSARIAPRARCASGWTSTALCRGM